MPNLIINPDEMDDSREVYRLVEAEALLFGFQR